MINAAKGTGRGTPTMKLYLSQYLEKIPIDGVMVEVGSCKGESTVIFAKKFKKVYAIDPWEGFYQYGDKKDQYFDQDMIDVEKEFDENIKQFNNIQKIKSKSELVYDQFADHSLDFVYIDGCHTYDAVRRDLTIWIPKVKKGSYFGGHDYCNGWPLIVKAIHECFGGPPDILVKGGNWAYKV
jgi:hypothetical protein